MTDCGHCMALQEENRGLANQLEKCVTLLEKSAKMLEYAERAIEYYENAKCDGGFADNGMIAREWLKEWRKK